jgi:hypothetical protein
MAPISIAATTPIRTRHPRFHCRPIIILLMVVLIPGSAWGGDVHALFDLSTPQGAPFPCNLYTKPDPSQITGLRIDLPGPNCPGPSSNCGDLLVLNALDGFNLQPRLSIPFDGAIDPTTATSDAVFLVCLGNTVPGGQPAGHVVGIDQVVWDPTGNTLHVESDEPLDQHTRYLLVVTKKLKDSDGDDVKAAHEFLEFAKPENKKSTGDPALDAYRATVRAALGQLDAHVVPPGQVIAASVFTTLSATATLQKIRQVIMQSGPTPTADFMIGPNGTRALYSVGALTNIETWRHTKVNPDKIVKAPPTQPSALQILNAVPNQVGKLAFGRYKSADFRVHPGEYIPPFGTLSGSPAIQGTPNVTFLLFLPASPPPSNGYPVAIYGHGGATNKGTSAFVAARLAQDGIATIAIDEPGGGLGPQTYVLLSFSNQPTKQIYTGGRGFDQNGDNVITEGEGFSPTAPRAVLGQGRGDGFLQWAADHMQLVRVIKAGVDAEGNGKRTLDGSRIYYIGPSGGGREGAILMAVEPDIRAGVLNDPNGSIEERLSAVRGNFPAGLGSSVPPLFNAPGVTSVEKVAISSLPYFDENLPLKNGALYSVTLQNGGTRTIKSPVVTSIPGALAIQQAMEQSEWAAQCSSSIAFAPYLRRHPLPGVPPKPVIIQFAYGDRRIPNPSTTLLLEAGDLANRSTFFRSDKAFATNPEPFPFDASLYPHSFLQIFADQQLTGYALQAQGQIAKFFALDGTNHLLDPFNQSQITDPDGGGPIFEVPAASLPNQLDYPK